MKKISGDNIHQCQMVSSSQYHDTWKSSGNYLVFPGLDLNFLEIFGNQMIDLRFSRSWDNWVWPQ